MLVDDDDYEDVSEGTAHQINTIQVKKEILSAFFALDFYSCALVN